MDDLLGWIDTGPAPQSPSVKPRAEAPPSVASIPKPSESVEDAPPIRRVRPCLTVLSPEYHRASLRRKFRAAAMTGTIPCALEVQRDLQRLLLSPRFDMKRAVELLMLIEERVRIESLRTESQETLRNQRKEEDGSSFPDKNDASRAGARGEGPERHGEGA